MILRAYHPYNHVIIAISRSDKRGAATAGAPVHIPTAGDGSRRGWGESEKIGPGWKRITASPPCQSGGLKVLPVITNGFFPSLAMPPTPHMAPPWVLVAAAHAVMLAGLFIGTPTSQP